MSELIFDEALKSIEKSRKKDINVIPFPFKRFCDLVPGVMQETSYLFGGYSGDGKSTIVDDLFMYNVFDYYSQNKDKIDVQFTYFSFELSKKRKILKGISRELFKRFNIRKDIRELQSLKKNRITDEEYELIKKVRDKFEILEDKLTIFDAAINPTGINKYIWSLADKNGKIETNNISYEGTERKIFKSYTPYNEDKYQIIILDHAALVHGERNFSDKELIDKTSEYSNIWRNNFRMTPVIIQQFSADTLSIDRIKTGRTEPDMNSFGESKTSVRNYDVIMAAYNPLKFDLKTHRGYKVVGYLNDYYRSLFLLKDRDGTMNRCVGIYFDGAMNITYELKKAEEITEDDYKNKNYF